MEASRDGNLEAVVRLLQLVDSDNIDMRDMVVYHWLWLPTQGLKINNNNLEYYTSLLWAALHGHAAIAQKLLDHGADVHATNEVIAYNPL